MGIFNMMIVIPMLLNAATLPFYYGPLLGGDARNVLTLVGVLLLCAAFAVMRVKDSELGYYVRHVCRSPWPCDLADARTGRQ